MVKRTAASIRSEQKYRDRLGSIQAKLMEDWQGCEYKHHVICANGHDCYIAAAAWRKDRGICKRCADQHPEDAQARYLTRLEKIGATDLGDPWGSAHTPRRVLDAAGHLFRPTMHNIRKGVKGCVECAGKNKGRSAPRFLEILRDWNCEPRDIWKSSAAKFWIKCPEGHYVQATPNNVLSGHRPCRACWANHDQLYVVSDGWGTVKVGITSGTSEDRLRRHELDGLDIVHMHIKGLPVNVAPELEFQVLRTLRTNQFKPCRGREYFPYAALPVILSVLEQYT